jgi:hypothetical protein
MMPNPSKNVSITAKYVLGRIFSRPPDIADGTLPFSDVQADHRKDHQRQKRPP